MPSPKSIQDYLRAFCDELGERIVANFPPLHGVADPVSPRLDSLLRRPFPAQEIAIMGVARRWERARSAAVIAECGTGKTLISLAAIHVHSDGKADHFGARTRSSVCRLAPARARWRQSAVSPA